MTGVNGAWTIESVQVDAEQVGQRDGFEKLIVSRDHMAIEPAGIDFSVSQATNRTAILESQKQVFFAEYSRCDDQLIIELSRPTFQEKIRLNATMN